MVTVVVDSVVIHTCNVGCVASHGPIVGIYTGTGKAFPWGTSGNRLFGRLLYDAGSQRTVRPIEAYRPISAVLLVTREPATPFGR